MTSTPPWTRPRPISARHQPGRQSDVHAGGERSGAGAPGGRARGRNRACVREAAGPLGVAIRWQEYPQDLPDLGEQRLEVVLQGVIAQVADEDFGSDGTL